MNHIKLIVLSGLLFAPFFSSAQNDSKGGVHFEQSLNWRQVQEKAKRENKYIFLDCFATWCGPCKQMDNEVYPDTKVGKALNDQFISVKLQMDSTMLDVDIVKAWRPIAKEMEKKYRVSALPTFLFLTAEGKLLDKAVGSQKKHDFITLIEEAAGRSKYYQLLAEYQKGKIDYTVMPYLAETSKHLGDKELSTLIASSYIRNYLDSLSEVKLLTRKNIDFLTSFSNVITYVGVSEICYTLFRGKTDHLFAGKEMQPML